MSKCRNINWMSRELELRFDSVMFDVYRRAKQEAGYNATRFLQMLDEHRGPETESCSVLRQYLKAMSHFGNVAGST